MAAALAIPLRSPQAAPGVPTGYDVSVQPRSTWAGEDLGYDGTPEPDDVRFLLVHHTAGPAGDPIRTMRGVHSFHTGSARGWPDVAYHFFIAPDGTVYEGRTGSLDGAVVASATGGNQGFAQLVCLLGDFTNEQPTPEALDALVGTLAWLADRYGLDTSPGAVASFVSRGSNRWPEGSDVIADVISGHREMSATACPGDTFFPYLKENVQRQVHERRAIAPVPATTVVGPGSESAPRPSPSTSTTIAPPDTVSSSVPDGSPEPVSSPDADTDEPVSGQLTNEPIDGPSAAPPEPARSTNVVVAPTDDGDTDDPVDPLPIAIGVVGVAVVGATATWAGVRGRHDDVELADGDDQVATLGDSS